GVLVSDDYPDPLGRAWSALQCAHSGDVLLSAAPGHEFTDWGGAGHLGAGSHGSMHRDDSLCPLLWCGAGPASSDGRTQSSVRDESAQVIIDDRTGRVLESWSGFQVAWSMARGYPGAFGRKAGALYVWIPLLVLFVVPFVDRRRLRSRRHLDLLVLASFSVSLAFFSHGEIGISVPLAYPPLAYLLVRML